MNIKDLKNINDFHNLDDDVEIVIDGDKFYPDELTMRTLTVHGVQPSDFEDWQHLNVLCQLRLKKPDSKGYAQTNYRYPHLEDLNKFHEHQYPYKIPVIMADSADKGQKVSQFIVYADFANVTELELVERKPKQVQQPIKPKV